jgi:hypothetical protein
MRYSRRSIDYISIIKKKKIIKKIKRMVCNFSLDLRREYLLEMADIRID